MRATKLIVDGYNVLFEAGLLSKRRQAGWMDQERRRLVQMLVAGLPGDLKSAATIVFDKPKYGATPEDSVQDGIDVVFARDHLEADDLIEEMIHHHSHPQDLVVVSSDHRLRLAIQSRRGTWLDADSFLYQLQHRSGLCRSVAEPSSGNTDESVESEREVDAEYWLKEFGFDGENSG